MYGNHLFLWCVVVCLVHGQENTTTTESSDREDPYIDLKTNKPVNIEKTCDKVPCLVKCCPLKEIILKDENGTLSCIDNIEYKYALDSSDYSKSDVEIYDKGIKREIIKTKKRLTDFTFLSHNKFDDLTSCCINLVDEFVEPQNKIYLVEDGRIVTSRINYVNNWYMEFPTTDFCFEHQISLNENGSLESTKPQVVFYGYAMADPGDIDVNYRAKLSAYGMLVSCWFMLLVLVVYGLLEELRNLAGMMLMAYVATLTVAFIVRAVQVFTNDSEFMDTDNCVVVGLIFIYTILASFTWMNVMSFDIWWSMRGFRKSRRIHRRGIPVKFAWYCLYAWGVPLIPTLFIVIVEHLDLSHLPNFVKPHIVVNIDQCFLPNDERQLYLNAPIAIATFTNFVLFVMTAYNIWRIKNGVARSADSKRNKKDENRFGIYLRLSMVMGFSWFLEVMSSLVYPDSPVWYISDIYNTLLGLFIFIIFVCKRNVLKLLCKRFEIENEYVGRWYREANSTKTTSSRGGKGYVRDSVTENSDVTDAFNDVKHC